MDESEFGYRNSLRYQKLEAGKTSNPSQGADLKGSGRGIVGAIFNINKAEWTYIRTISCRTTKWSVISVNTPVHLHSTKPNFSKSNYYVLKAFGLTNHGALANREVACPYTP